MNKLAHSALCSNPCMLEKVTVGGGGLALASAGGALVPVYRVASALCPQGHSGAGSCPMEGSPSPNPPLQLLWVPPPLRHALVCVWCNQDLSLGCQLQCAAVLMCCCLQVCCFPGFNILQASTLYIPSWLGIACSISSRVLKVCGFQYGLAYHAETHP